MNVTAKALSALPAGPCEQSSRGDQRHLDTVRVESDTTLGVDANVVVVRRGLQVTGGTTLTVEPGTTLVFGESGSLSVAGTLSAAGTCSAPIAFVGEAGSWRGVTFESNGGGTLDHVLLEGAGGERTAAVTVRSDGAVDLTNTEVRGGPGDAVAVADGGSFGTFDRNALAGSDGPAVRGPVGALDALDAGTSYGSAGESPVVVESSTVGEGETVELEALGVPYDVAPAGRGGIAVAGSLTVAPGATLRFGQNGQLVVEGRGELVADAGGGDPIRFVGGQDVRGAWAGLRFRDATSTENVLRNVVVAAAGAGDGGQGLLLAGESRVSVADSEFRGNENYAVRLQQNATMESFDGNRFVDNDATVWTSARTARFVGPANEFEDNDDDRVVVYAGEFDGHVVPEGEDHTWSNPGVPLFVEPARGGSFGVYGSLTLSEGLTLQFGQDNGIYVTGSLATDVDAEGLPEEIDATDPPGAYVTFEGDQATAGFWKGIAYDGTRSTDNVLEFVEIRHAGGGRAPASTGQRDAAVKVLQGARLRFQAALVEETAGYGLFAQRENALDTVAGVHFRNNEAPMFLYADSVSQVGAGLGFEGNETEMVFVRPPVEAVTDDISWAAIDVPYRVLPSQVGPQLTIGSNAVIQDGTEIRFEQDVGVLVEGDGSLRCVGLGEEPTDPNTILRGVEAVPGHWDGVRYTETTSPENRIDGTGIYHTGAASWPRLPGEDATAAVAATKGAEATVAGSHVAEFDGVAFAAESRDNPNRQEDNATLNLQGNVVE